MQRMPAMLQKHNNLTCVMHVQLHIELRGVARCAPSLPPCWTSAELQARPFFIAFDTCQTSARQIFKICPDTRHEQTAISSQGSDITANAAGIYAFAVTQTLNTAKNLRGLA